MRVNMFVVNNKHGLSFRGDFPLLKKLVLNEMKLFLAISYTHFQNNLIERQLNSELQAGFFN